MNPVQIELQKMGLFNSIMALHQLFTSEGLSVEESKKLTTSMCIDYLKTFNSEVEDIQVTDSLEKARQTLLSIYKESSTPERDRAKIKRFIESYDDIKHLL